MRKIFFFLNFENTTALFVTVYLYKKKNTGKLNVPSLVHIFTTIVIVLEHPLGLKMGSLFDTNKRVYKMTLSLAYSVTNKNKHGKKKKKKNHKNWTQRGLSNPCKIYTIKNTPIFFGCG